MAIPAGTLAACTTCVGLSADGATYTDYSTYVTVLEPPEQTRTSGQIAVLGNDTMIINVGKREPLNITVRGVYVDSTATTNPFSLLYTAWTTSCGGPMFVRWAPAGCTTSNQVFGTGTATTDQSELISLTFPGGDSGSGDPLTWQAVIFAPVIYRAVYAA